MSIPVLFLIALLFLPQLSFLFFLPSDNQLLWALFLAFHCKSLVNIKLNYVAKNVTLLLGFGFALSIASLFGQYLFQTQLSERVIFDSIKQFVSYFLVILAFLSGCILSSSERLSRNVYLGLWISIAVCWFFNFARLIFPPEFFLFFFSRTLDSEYALSARGLSAAFSEPSFVSSWALIMSLFYPYLCLNKFITVNKSGLNYASKFLANHPNLYLLNLLLLSLFSASGQIAYVFLLVIACLLLASSMIGLKTLFRKVRVFRINKYFLLALFSLSPLLFLADYLLSNLSENSRFLKYFNIILEPLNVFSSGFQDILLLFDISALLRLHSFVFPLALPLLMPFDMHLSKNLLMQTQRSNYSELHDRLQLAWQALFGNIEFVFPRRLYSILGNYSYDFALVGLILVALITIFFYKATYRYSSICFSQSFDATRAAKSPALLLPLFFALIAIASGFLNLSLLFSPYWVALGFVSNWSPFRYKSSLAH